MLKDMLIQMLFFLIPVYAYQLFFHGRLPSNRPFCKVLLGVAGGIVAAFCMSFPFYLGDGMRLDMSVVALIVVMLYGGVEAGLITFCLTLTYRAFLGVGLGFTLSIIIATLNAIVVLIVARRQPSLSRKHKLYAGLIASTCGSIITIAVLCVGSMWDNGSIPALHRIEFYVDCCLPQILATLMSIYLIETTRDTTTMRVELQRREKMDLIGELAAAMAHEIRNPLAVVRGFLQLSKEATNPMYIDMSIREIDHAESIIKDYLSFAKPTVSRPERFSVGELLVNVADSMAPYATMQNAEVACSINMSGYIEADRTKFKQAMMNLVKNAIEAQSTTVELRCEVVDGYVHVSVEDKGLGMTREQIQRIGQPFYSTKAKGTGLGLMVTIRLIEAMNGKVHFDSVKGEGTIVSVAFPCAGYVRDITAAEATYRPYFEE